MRLTTHCDYNDFAVLYRTNAQSRELEEALRERNIPYRIYGGMSFYQRKEIKDAIAYFRLTINPDDEEALKRVINYPARGIGNTTLSKLIERAHSQESSIWKVISDPIGHNLAVNNGTLNKLKTFKDLIDELRYEADKRTHRNWRKRLSSDRAFGERFPRIVPPKTSTGKRTSKNF